LASPPAPPVSSPHGAAPARLARHEAADPRPAPGDRGLQPGLELPDFLHGAIEPVRPPSPPPPRTRLFIARSDRRDIDLEVTATSVRGQVRGRSVALTLAGNGLSGRIGDDEVIVHIFGSRRASGSVGGRELDFFFTPTDGGWLVDVQLPELDGHVRLEAGHLSFWPGCQTELGPVAHRPGAYEGTCSDETRTRIELPTPFLTPMARLVVLGMLLPEPEPVLRGTVRGLFPPP
jgi:hypothetical protein